MLENTIEQTDLTTPADAIELSTDDLEEVTGAWIGTPFGFGGCGSCFGFSCFSFFREFREFRECIEFVHFGSCFSSCF